MNNQLGLHKDHKWGVATRSCTICGQLEKVEPLVAPEPREAPRQATVDQHHPWMDWEQVRLNGGPPCFHLDPEHEGNRFCGRAQRWFGHTVNESQYPDHRFISLDDYLAELRESRQPLLNKVKTCSCSCHEDVYNCGGCCGE